MSVPTSGDLVGLKARHVENVRERVEIMAFGKPRQLFRQGGDIESGTAGGFRRRHPPLSDVIGLLPPALRAPEAGRSGFTSCLYI